jgi:hypothetical protein
VYEESQHSLANHPDSDSYEPEYANANVNVEPAWEVMDGASWSGNSPVIGVFDSGAVYTHEDFDCEGNCPDGLSGSVFLDAVDFVIDPDGVPVPPGDPSEMDAFGHGTLVAGLIGAVRENGIGVQGIAGGHFNLNGTKKIGAKLKSFRFLDEVNFAPATRTATTAMYALNPGGTPLVDVFNNSYGHSFDPPSSFPQNEQQVMRQTFEMIYEAELIVVNSRGYTPDEEYPATIKDAWGLSVGGSGNDGNYMDDANGADVASGFGKEMDLVAPGTFDITHTTDADLSSYAPFGGTSGATPHVAGAVAALLQLEIGDLYMEDIEHFIEYSATDLVGGVGLPLGQLPGYDDKTGWGRLNVGDLFNLVDQNGDNLNVVHVNVNGFETVEECDSGTEDCFYVFEFPVDDPEINTTFDAPGTIVPIKYYADFSVSICDQSLTLVSFSDPAKVSYWPLNTISNLWGAPITLNNPQTEAEAYITPFDDVYLENIVQVSNCQLTGRIIGYKYKIIADEDDVFNPARILPDIPDEEVIFAFTLMVEGDPTDPEISVDHIPTSTEEVSFQGPKISLVPNPIFNSALLIVESEMSGELAASLYGTNGQIIRDYSLSSIIAGRTDIPIELSGIPAGLYFLKARLNEQHFVIKLIKL